MSPTGDLLEVAVQLADILDRLGLPFAFGGAIAQNYWGTVRATQDVDILVALPRIRFEELAAALDAAGYIMRDQADHEIPVSVPAMVAQDHVRDVRGILWAQRGKLDLAYVREWAGRMLAEKIVEELERWIRKYGTGRRPPHRPGWP